MKLDATEENSPGWKFAEWELRGVPLRLEIGPKDIEKAQVFSARRDTREKAAIPLADLATRVPALLEEIQANLLGARPRVPRGAHERSRDVGRSSRPPWKAGPGFVIASWCGTAECEAAIKAETQATLRNIPLGSPRQDGRLRQVQRRLAREGVVREGVPDRLRDA